LPKSSFKASDVFDTFALSIIRNGGYLNSIDLINGLQGEILDLDKMYRFKEIQSTNKVVHSAVTCYWGSRSVRIYAELEEFVIDKLTGYQHRESRPKLFTEFGMGNLCKNEVVLKYFQFYKLQSAEDLPAVSTEEVIICMLDFLRSNRNVFKVDSSGSTEELFRAFLKKSYRVEFTGVDVDFKSLFYSTQHARKDWFQALRSCKEKYGKEYKDGLCAALDNLLSNKSHSAPHKLTSSMGSVSNAAVLDSDDSTSRLDERFLRSIDIDVRSLAAQYREIVLTNPLFDPSQEFLSSATAIMFHRGTHHRVGFGLGIAATRVDTCWLHLSHASARALVESPSTENVLQVALAHPIPKKAKELLVSSVLGLLNYLVNSETKQTEAKDEQEVDIRSWFTAHLVSDVPDELFTVIKAFVKKIVNPEKFIRIVSVGGAGRGERATLDWVQVRQVVETELTGSPCGAANPVLVKPKGAQRRTIKITVNTPTKSSMDLPANCTALSAGSYLAVLTMSVLFHRVLQAEMPSQFLHSAPLSVSLVVCGFVVRNLNDVLSDPDGLAEVTAKAAEIGITYALVDVFLTIERNLLAEFSVPSFECARLGGSFLQFLSVKLSTSSHDAPEEENALREAVCKLQMILSCSSGSSEEFLVGHFVDPHEESNSAFAANAPAPENLLAAVFCHLDAVLRSREFDSSSATVEGETSAISSLAQLLLDVERRVQQGEGYWAEAGAGATTTSFLGIVAALLAEDAETAGRVERLAAPFALIEHISSLNAMVPGEDTVQVRQDLVPFSPLTQHKVYKIYYPFCVYVAYRIAKCQRTWP
jgi:hypothetical protein